MAKANKSNYPLLTCMPKSLPPDVLLDAVRGGGDRLDEPRLGALAAKFWGKGGVALTVGFLDGPEGELCERILGHMNAWGEKANVRFTESNVDPQVRIRRDASGYWSYLGTDILLIKNKDDATMNLEGFTMQTPEEEFRRVVRHETGHTLGFPHEHMREDLVALIDWDKAIAHFQHTQGWSKQEVIAQVLTPIENLSLLNPDAPDPNSIMCYQIPGKITKSGDPILGGMDISKGDAEYAAKLYRFP